jgi:hypothetical protein
MKKMRTAPIMHVDHLSAPSHRLVKLSTKMI